MALDASFQQFLSSAPRLILGSTSRWRRDVMHNLGQKYNFKYELTSADIDERAIRFKDPEELVSAISKAKADALIKKLQVLDETYLLTADQVVVWNGTILEKPVDAAEARAFIRDYGGHPAETVGSVMCTHIPSKKTHACIERARIYMTPIPDECIEELIQEGAVFHTAGGLMIEHPLVGPHIEQIVGNEDAVKGMSQEIVLEALLGTWHRVKKASS